MTSLERILLLDGFIGGHKTQQKQQKGLMAVDYKVDFPSVEDIGATLQHLVVALDIATYLLVIYLFTSIFGRIEEKRKMVSVPTL
jgi:hypothetical protein